MRASRIIAVIVLVLAAAGAAALLVRHEQPEWTTDSKTALEHVELGLEAAGKVYFEDAREQYELALKADPDMVAARIFLLQITSSSRPERARLIEQLKQVDPSRLNDRERFLLGYHLAAADRDLDRAARLVEEYGREHPDDRFVIMAQAERATARHDFTEAERLLKRLIEVAPNQVRGYNDLGYLAMGRGDFQASEKMFKTYRYIAPDQANPHDSLGELYVVMGRYNDAAQAFKEALDAKSDFCPALMHLAQVYSLDGRFDEAERVLERETSTCAQVQPIEQRCLLEMYRAVATADWETIWRSGGGECAETTPARSLTRYQAALRTGRLDEAAAIAGAIRKELGDRLTGDFARVPRAIVLHVEGSRMLAEGKAAAAVEQLREADAKLSYRSLDEALPKLLNRMVLVAALGTAGAQGEADALEREVRAVNPRFAERFAFVLEKPAAATPAR